MKRTVLGLYLSDSTTQALALEHTPVGMVVRALAEWKSSLFSYAGDDTPGVDEFVEHLSPFIRDNNLAIKSASVTLDSGLLFINTIPMRDSASRSEIADHLRWELNEYFPTMSESFISDTHQLASKSDEIHDTTLMVSVRRDRIQTIKRSLSRLQLDLDIVDVDHFSADTALRQNYPDTANKLVALVGIKERRIDFSVIHHNETESYSYMVATTANEIVQRASEMANSTRNLTSLSIYGTHLTPEILSQLREATQTPIETVNPFRSIDVADSVRLRGDPTLTSYRYCPVVGVALRNN